MISNCEKMTVSTATNKTVQNCDITHLLFQRLNYDFLWMLKVAPINRKYIFTIKCELLNRTLFGVWVHIRAFLYSALLRGVANVITNNALLCEYKEKPTFIYLFSNQLYCKTHLFQSCHVFKYFYVVSLHAYTILTWMQKIIRYQSNIILFNLLKLLVR